MMRVPRIQLDIEATPVAIALIAVAGIIFIAYSPMEPENKRLAIMALGQLAGGAAGVAIPRGSRLPSMGSRKTLGNAPASHPPEW